MDLIAVGGEHRTVAGGHGGLRVGGRYQLEGNASGQVLVCDPLERFEVTWELGDDCTWLTIVPRAGAGGEETELELRHLAPVPEEMWHQYGPGAVGIGWELGLMGLDRHLATGASVDGAEAMTWTVSPDGLAFVNASSDGWAAAAVAAGTDPVAATAAAQRVTGFYTASPEAPPEAGTPPDGAGGSAPAGTPPAG